MFGACLEVLLAEILSLEWHYAIRCCRISVAESIEILAKIKEVSGYASHTFSCNNQKVCHARTVEIPIALPPSLQGELEMVMSLEDITQRNAPHSGQIWERPTSKEN